MEYKILTFDKEDQEYSWTNPPTKQIDKIWEFIERIFKGVYIKSFLFMNEIVFDKGGNILNTVKHMNPKKPDQPELF